MVSGIVEKKNFAVEENLAHLTLNYSTKAGSSKI
jgi:hypothetical protein